MQKAKYDLSVLLIFFTRPDTLEKVFEKVRQARPARLFLACDGPRKDRPEDLEKIERCKAIVENIDWECEVHTLYSDVNQGCGKGPSGAITWAFTHTDKLVILEDDCVPNESFFGYMEHLLDRYANDERVGMISGLNHFKDWDCGGYSYCFTKTGAIWGWGTWKRVWDMYNYSISAIHDPHLQKMMQGDIMCKRAKTRKVNNFVETAKRIESGENISYWDVQFGFLKYCQSLLSIVPKTNLICNIGAGADSTHAKTTGESQWKKGMVLFMPTTLLEMPLQDPPYMIRDNAYDKAVDSKWGYPHPVKRNFGRGVRLMKRILKKF